MATWLWVRSEWRRSWPAVFGLALVVAVVVGAVAALWFGARRADSATDRFSAAIGQPNVEMQAPLGEVDPQSVAELNRHVELLPQAAEVPGVEAASAMSWWALAPEGDVEPGQTVSPFVVGFSARAEGPSPFIVLDGELPPDDDPSSVVVNESMAETGVGVGSTIRLRSVAPADIAEWAENDAVLPDETHLTGPTIDAHVAAVVRLPDDLADARFPSLGLLPGFEKAHGADVAHVVQAAQFRVDPSRLAEAEAALQKVYAQYGLVPVTLQDNLAPVRQAVAVEARTLQVAAVVAALAGLLVATQVLGRAIARLARHHDARRALGASSTDLTAGGVLGVAPALVVGVLVGMLGSVALSAAFPVGLARRVEPDPGIRVEVLPLAVTTAVILAVLLGVAVLLARRAARVVGTTSVGSRLRVVRLLRRPTTLLGASFAVDPMADARRSGMVAAATVLSIAVGVMAVITVATLESSLSELRGDPALAGAPGRYVWESNGAFGSQEALDLAMSRPDVTSVTEQLQLDEQELAVGVDGVALAPMAFRSLRGSGLPVVTDGRLPSSPDEVALGERTAARLDAGIGDELVLTDVTGAPVPLRVVGTLISWGVDETAEAFVVSPERLQQSACAGAALEECNLVAILFADPQGTAAQKALSAGGYTETFPPSSVERMQQVGRIPWYLASFLALLALVATFNLLVTTLRRRRRDLAVARVFGMTARGSGAPLSLQAVFLATAGAALGLLLGILGGRVLWRVLADDLVVVYRPDLDIWVAVVVPVVAVAVALVVSVGPAIRAGRLPPGAVLRAE